MAMFCAAANRSSTSSPLDRANKSVAVDATSCQVADGVLIVIAKFDSLRVTEFFVPAINQFPFACVTATAGAPHCSRDNFGAFASSLAVFRCCEKETAAAAIRTMTMQVN